MSQDIPPFLDDLTDWRDQNAGVITFEEPMSGLTLSVDDDHVMHIYCHSQVKETALERLRKLLTSG